MGKSVVSTAHKTARDPNYSHADQIEDMLRGSVVLSKSSAEDRSDDYWHMFFHMLENIQKLLDNKVISSIIWKDKGLMAGCFDDGHINKEKIKAQYKKYKGVGANDPRFDDGFEEMYSTCMEDVIIAKKSITGATYKDSRCVITFNTNAYLNETGDHALKDMNQILEFKILLADRKETNESGLAHHDWFRFKQDIALKTREDKYITAYDLVRDLAGFVYAHTDAIERIRQEMQSKNLSTENIDILKYLLKDLSGSLCKCKLNMPEYQSDDQSIFYMATKIRDHQEKVGQAIPHTLVGDQGKITDDDIDALLADIPEYRSYREAKLKDKESAYGSAGLTYYIRSLAK